MIDYEPKRWLRVVFTMQGSVAPRLLLRVAVAFVLGLVAVWAHRSSGVAMPPLAHTLIGVALGLLLVFRTNASYGRYIEARELVGRITNSSRDLARQIATYVAPHGEHATMCQDCGRHIGAFYRLVVQSLRDERDLTGLQDRLLPHERMGLEPVVWRPLVVMTWLSAKLRALVDAGHLTEERLRAMDNNLNTLVSAFGGCDRIRRTPVPFAYAQHIKIFVLLFCYTVPFAMADTLLGYTPFATAVLAFALFGIDEIGVEIEDPFGRDPNDLPLDRIGDAIDTSTREILSSRV